MNIDYAGGQRIAMRTGAGTGTSGLSYLLADHLGSPAVTVNAATNAVTRTGYKPWGEERYGAAPSTFSYTGQRDEPDLDIMFYGARWYDSALHRFVQADSIVPNPYNPLDWDRYGYVRGNPVKYNDPTGHAVSDGNNQGACDPQRCPTNPPMQNPPQQPSLPTVSQPEYTYVPIMSPNQGLIWKAVPLQKPTPVTDYVNDRILWSSTTWGYISTTLDVLAWVTDLYAAGVVTYGGIAGAGITSPFILAGLPEVPVASGWAGAAVAELCVQPVLRLGNILATASTTATYISETKAGKTVIETGQISNLTKNSVSLTVLGWAAPSEAYISFVFQSTAVLNDFGVISIPFR